LACSNVDTAGDTGLYSSIAIGQTWPAISYYDNTAGHLRYASYNGSNWTYQTVDLETKAGMYTSLAMTTDHQPRISYYDGDSNDLRYAIWKGTYWRYSRSLPVGMWVYIPPWLWIQRISPHILF